MVEPAPDEGGDRDDDDAVADELGVLAGRPRQANEDHVGHGEADGVTQAVPADGDGTELEGDGIGRDVEHPAECTGAGASTDPSLYFATVNAEFNWWMLMVGLVVGAGLVWFVVADQRRREVDIDADERAREALWLSTTLTDEGENVSPELAERLLALHRDLSRGAATGRGGRHGPGRPAVAPGRKTVRAAR